MNLRIAAPFGVLFTLSVLVGTGPARAELRVSAFTAYLDPDPEGARISERSGITPFPGSCG